MMSIWDAPSDRDVIQWPWDPALEDEEPQPVADDPAGEGFTEDACPF